MRAVYDRIGRGYSATRRADARIARAIWDALGDAAKLVNVGAGTGSYEPLDRRVVAVEPSVEMISQRPARAAPVVRAAAENLPFGDGSFDAALAVLTVHHWTDWAAGLGECARVARRVVIFTWDPTAAQNPRGLPFWLTEYLSSLVELDRHRFPSPDEIVERLGPLEVRPVSVPADCTDGFGGAFWARPEAYLDPEVRAGMSSFALSHAPAVDRGLQQLAADLESGHWDSRFGHLRRLLELDLGYRLLIWRSCTDSAGQPVN